MKRSLACLGLVAACLSACQDRAERTRARAGVGIALEVRYTAAQLARRIGGAPHPACVVDAPEGPYSQRVDWVVEGFREDALTLRLEESRTLDVDASGRVRYLRRVDFQSEHGRSGTRERELRVVDGQVYHRDDNLPFERRPVDVSEVTDLLGEVSDVFETLVRATGDGWSRIERTEGGWRLVAQEGAEGGERVGCGAAGASDPWLQALLARMAVVHAEADVSYEEDGGTWGRRGSWVLAPVGSVPGRSLRVDLSEQLRVGSIQAEIEVPAEVVSLERDRLHRDLSAFVRELEGMLDPSD